jgi:hypothetical protein
MKMSRYPSSTRKWQAAPTILVVLTMLLPGVFAPLSYPAVQSASSAQSAGTRLALPPQMPVYSLSAPVVNAYTAQSLASLFEGIGAQTVVTETSQFSTPFYLTGNPDTGALLEQYGASGGFFAFNASRAFAERPANLDYGPWIVCNFLASNKLFPYDINPENTNCNGQGLNYTNSLVYNTILTPTLPSSVTDITAWDGVSAISETQIIAQVWQIPLEIDIAEDVGIVGARYPIPLTGPGGHLTLLLTGYDQSPSLDESLPGLQALANPYFRRMRMLLGLFDTIQPFQAKAEFQRKLQAMFPGAEIHTGEPQIGYYVEDAAEPQEALLPVWTFPDATAIVDGEVVNLRGTSLPAVAGFLPGVSITAPPNGSLYTLGTPLDLTAVMTPTTTSSLTYTLMLEGGTPIVTGTTTGGEVQIAVDAFPVGVRPEEPGFFLRLGVADANGGYAEDTLQLNLAPQKQIFMPLIPKTSSFLEMFFAHSVDSPLATRKMGVEWVQYYNGTLPNLPGVPPDGDGFYSGLQSLGWSGQFRWVNNNAWAKDWKDVSLGGIDSTFGVDRAEFVYFAGHGSPARIYFGVNKDAYNAYGEDARFQNVRWAGFASCQTLRAGPWVAPGNPPLSHWFNAFQGAYMLMGFHSNMADVHFGPRLVDNMRPITFFGWTLFQRTIREAWVLTAFEMNAGKPAYLYVVNNSMNPVDYKLPDSSSSLPPLLNVTQYRWVWWE